MKWTAILVASALFIFSWRGLHSQEPTSAASRRFHLIQVVDPNILLDKINEAAAQGYRLIAATRASGPSLCALLERMNDASATFSYTALQPPSDRHRIATPGKVASQVAEQLNAAAAKGFHLRAVLGATQEQAPEVPLMESNSEPQQSYKYAAVAPNLFGYYRNSDISPLLAAGYRWTTTTAMLYHGSLLMFEQSAASSAPPATSQSQLAPFTAKRFDFPENNVIRSQLPEKQLRKLAAHGARILDFFGSPVQMILAMAETEPSSAPCEYVILKPKNLSSPLALRAKMTTVEASELSELGRRGFRMLALSASAPPFVMEKSPGRSAHYEYQFASSQRLPELAQQLNRPALSDFHVLKFESLEDGLLVVMEKSDAGAR